MIKYLLKSFLIIPFIFLTSCMMQHSSVPKSRHAKIKDDYPIYRYFLEADSTFLMVDDTKNNWFTIEFKADTLFQNEEKEMIYDNRKLLQIHVIPFSEFLPHQKSSLALPKVLQAYKKWELDYQQKGEENKLESGEEFYYRDDKPFLIWWLKNPPKTNYKKRYDIETGKFVEGEPLNVTYMLCLSFPIYGYKNVAITIPVFENEILKEEIEKLKEVANSLRVYGGNIDFDVLLDKKNSQGKYFLQDSLNFLELEVPDWLNVIKPIYHNMFGATFPEKNEVVNALLIRWDYKSDSLTFNDFVNRFKLPSKNRNNYKLIEETDSTFKYYCISENGWFCQKYVFLKGDNAYCMLTFTATKNTYDYNIDKFEAIVKKIKLK